MKQTTERIIKITDEEVELFIALERAKALQEIQRIALENEKMAIWLKLDKKYGLGIKEQKIWNYMKCDKTIRKTSEMRITDTLEM